MFKLDWVTPCSKTPVTSQLRVNSRALTTAYKDRAVQPLDPSLTSFLPLIQSTPATLTPTYSSNIPSQLLPQSLAQPPQKASLLTVISQKCLS